METVISIFKSYNGTGLYGILFLACLLYLWHTEEDKKLRVLLVYCPALMTILFFIPYCYAIYNHLDDGTYYRILWLLPMTVLIAYVGCKIVGRHTRLGLLIAVVVLILSGTWSYKSPYITRAENLYHLPQETIDLCDMIKPEKGKERVWAAFPVEQVHFVRQYTSSIQMPFGRDSLVAGWDHIPNAIFDIYQEPEIELKGLADHAQEYYINYFVLLKEKPIVGNPVDYDMEYVGETQNYIVYKNNTVPLP